MILPGWKFWWKDILGIAEIMTFAGIHFGGWTSLSHNDIHSEMAIIRNNNDMTLFFGGNNIARLLSNRQSAKINSPPKFPARRYNIHTEIMDEHANKTPITKLYPQQL